MHKNYGNQRENVISGNHQKYRKLPQKDMNILAIIGYRIWEWKVFVMKLTGILKNKVDKAEIVYVNRKFGQPLIEN